MAQTVSLSVRQGRIDSIAAVPGPARAVILPLPVDPHVHLDKTFTSHRCRASKPGLFGAIEAMAADMPNWTGADLRARVTRALNEAYGNGISAMRSHIDWGQAAVPLAWNVLGELADEWRGRLTLQRAALAPLDLVGDPDIGPQIAAQVTKDAAVLGCFVYRNSDLDTKLALVFGLAERHGLRLDFHVDEGLDPLLKDLITSSHLPRSTAWPVVCFAAMPARSRSVQKQTLPARSDRLLKQASP